MAPVTSPSPSSTSRSTILRYTSNFTRSLSPSSSLSSYVHHLQVHLWTNSIMASKCILQFTWSRALSVSPISLSDQFKVHLSVYSISCSKCNSKLTLSRPPCASLNSLNHSLQLWLSVHSLPDTRYISKLAVLWPPCAFRSLLDLGLQVPLYTHSNRRLQLLCYVHSIAIFRHISNRPSTACSLSRCAVCWWIAI